MQFFLATISSLKSLQLAFLFPRKIAPLVGISRAELKFRILTAHPPCAAYRIPDIDSSQIKENILRECSFLFQVNIQPRCSTATRRPARPTPRRFWWCSPSFWVSWDNVRVHEGRPRLIKSMNTSQRDCTPLTLTLLHRPSLVRSGKFHYSGRSVTLFEELHEPCCH